MSVYADVQNAMTERRARLSQICAREVERVWPQYENRSSTLDRRRDLEGRLSLAIRQEMDEPFELRIIDKGSGQWSLDVQPLMTSAEKDALEASYRMADAPSP